MAEGFENEVQQVPQEVQQKTPDVELAVSTPEEQSVPAITVEAVQENLEEIHAENVYAEKQIELQVESGNLPPEEEEGTKLELKTALLKQRAHQIAEAADPQGKAPEVLTVGQLLQASEKIVSRQDEAFQAIWSQEDGAAEQMQLLQEGLKDAQSWAADQVISLAADLGLAANIDKGNVQKLVQLALKNTEIALPQDFDPTDKQQLREAIAAVLPFDAVAPMLAAQSFPSRAQEQSTNVPSESGAETGGESEEDASTPAKMEREETPRERALRMAQEELFYQMFENKQNNLEVFLQAFFDNSWRDLSGYSSLERANASKEKAGKQLGMKTMKDALGGGEMEQVNASLFRSVIAEVYENKKDLTVGGKSGSELIALGDADLLQTLKSPQAQQEMMTLFSSGDSRDRALYRIAEWTKGNDGNNEKKKSRSQLSEQARERLKKNLPKEDSYGVSQEALAYLLTRLA